jgi:hypothetical protein
MLKIGCNPDFLEKPVGAKHGSELGVKNLDRDLAIVFLVVPEVDRGHAAASELAFDHIASEGPLNLFEAVSHDRPFKRLGSAAPVPRAVTA